MNNSTRPLASNESRVGVLYKNQAVADSYIKKRFSFSWQRLLHKVQVSEINRVIRNWHPETILEIAPGPARLAADLIGVNRGVMIEYSEEMNAIARERLRDYDLEDVWTVLQGNAFELDRLSSLFNFIYTFRFIRHFHYKDRVRLYTTIAHRLTQGGLLMFDVVNAPTRKKLDLNHSPTSNDDLCIYDATYTEEEFRMEMKNLGFDILSMVPVLKYFEFQSYISYRFDKISHRFSKNLIKLIEKIPSKNPLEWIALCRKV